MLTRRTLVRALLIAAGSGTAYLVLGDSRERRVLRVLRECAAAVSDQPGDVPRQRAQRLASVSQKHLSPGFTLSVPELGTLEDKELREVLALSSGLGLSVEIDQSDVRFTSNGRARVNMLIEFVHRLGAEERREWRNAEAQLTERAGGYRLDRLDVSAPLEREPEPRP